MGVVVLPLTGSGDATARVAADIISSDAYQYVKLVDGTSGSTAVVKALATTPAAADGGLVVRPIGSTAFSQAVVSSGMTVDVSSQGSTKVYGINNYENFTVTSRTSVASSVDVELFALNTAHRVRIVQNHATGVELLLRLSTVAVTSGLGGSDIRIPALGYVVFGGQTGNFPLYDGSMRCKVNSTAINTATIGLALTT